MNTISACRLLCPFYLASLHQRYILLHASQREHLRGKLLHTFSDITQPCPSQRRGRKPLPCSPLCSAKKRERSCLEKLSKSTRINSLKPASLEAISEIISDLCSVVSFIVLCLISYFTTNIRTLELTHVLETVSRVAVSSFVFLALARGLFNRSYSVSWLLRKVNVHSFFMSCMLVDFLVKTSPRWDVASTVTTTANSR